MRCWHQPQASPRVLRQVPGNPRLRRPLFPSPHSSQCLHLPIPPPLVLPLPGAFLPGTCLNPLQATDPLRSPRAFPLPPGPGKPAYPSPSAPVLPWPFQDCPLEKLQGPPPATTSSASDSRTSPAHCPLPLRTGGAHSVVLGVLDPLVRLHASLTQGLGALHAVAGGRGVILAAGAALLGEGGVREPPPERLPVAPRET